MIETFRQSGYSRERVEFLLRNYARMVNGEPLAPREDRLGNQRCRQEDASWTHSAIIKADIEAAVQSLPFELCHILFECVMREDRETRRYDARRRSGYYWDKTPGQVNDMINTAISLVWESLNSGYPPLPVH